MNNTGWKYVDGKQHSPKRQQQYIVTLAGKNLAQKSSAVNSNVGQKWFVEKLSAMNGDAKKKKKKPKNTRFVNNLFLWVLSRKEKHGFRSVVRLLIPKRRGNDKTRWYHSSTIFRTEIWRWNIICCVHT